MLLDDVVADGADAFDPGLEDVAGLQEPRWRAGDPDAGGSAGEDDVAGQQRQDGGELGDEPGDAEDEVAVRASWTFSPLTEQPRARSSGSSSSSRVTTHGPIGPKPRRDLPRENCAPAANWRCRSLMSWPTVRPATCRHASASSTRSARAPITATSSTSQSTLSPPIAMSSYGPASDAGNLVNVAGTSGARPCPTPRRGCGS